MLEALLVMLAALAFDAAFGDPRNRYHPTAWIGQMIASITIRARFIPNRLGGVAVIIPVVMVVVASVTLFQFLLDIGLSVLPAYLQIAMSVLLGGIVLKSTIAIRGMKKYADAVLVSLNQNDIKSARTNLSSIVKRDTNSLSEKHVLSGVLESISENTVDGITGPIFYYAVFGLPGAFAYRVINTADSMIGYKTNMFRNVGWFAAKCDTVLNYVPSRLTGLVMVVSVAILRHDWRESYHIMMRDGPKTASYNAGYPMAALAGALGVQFENIGHYTLGHNTAPLALKHVQAGISVMQLTSVLFAGMVCVPIIAILSVMGWWIHV